MKRLGLFCTLFLMLAGIVHAGTPTAPKINTNNIINAANAPYNAVADGTTDNAAAIQAAIHAAGISPATNGLAGGTVKLPGPGVYLCGPLTLTNKLNLEIDGGATLKFLPVSTYPNASGSPASPIGATNLSDLEISGLGIIDGNGLGWWSNNPPNRPVMLFFSKCSSVLIQNVTLQNPPKMHIAFKNSAANINIQSITINTPPLGNSPTNAPNTDGIDLIGTNCLVQNCSITAGDDNIAIGSSSGVASDITVTNCAFGTGHGMTIGSNTEGGVSNLTVINCTFNGTQYGIRMKSDNASSGGSGQGGLAQNIAYYNLTMTNIQEAAFAIYSYYNEVGTPTSITPLTAANEPIPSPVPTTTCKWLNITISNVTASVSSGGIAGIIWGRTEVPMTNITFNHVTVSATKTFDIYNATGVQFLDSQVTVPGVIKTFTLFNAQLTVSNSTPVGSLVTFDGLATNGLGNSLALYNAQASLQNTNVLNLGSLTLGSSTLTVSNNLVLTNSDAFNFTPGTSASQLAVAGNLSLGGSVNLAAGNGFGVGTYTLFTATGILSGTLPTLGTTPPGFNYVLNTNTAGQVNLVVTSLAPFSINNVAASPRQTGAIITWNTTLPATSQVQYGLTTNYGSSSAFDAALLTNHMVWLAGLSPSNTYFYRAVSTLGTNQILSPGSSFFTDPSVILTSTLANYTGVWILDSTAPDKFSPTYQYAATVIGADTAEATFRPTITLPGLYDVYIWYSASNNRSLAAPVTVSFPGGGFSTAVNMSVNGGSWQLLGSGINLPAGTNTFVRLGNGSGETNKIVIADAVRFTYSPGQDANQNGTVPAWWSNFYFGASVNPFSDTDGDGYNAFSEYVLGTDPTDANSKLNLSPQALPGGGVAMVFSPYQAGRLYQAQALTGSGVGANWTTLSNLPVTINGNGQGVINVTNQGGTGRFLRLAVQLMP